MMLLGTFSMALDGDQLLFARKKFKKNLIEGKVKRFAFYWVPPK